MSRVFPTTTELSELSDVVRRDDTPVTFRWRDRSYAVDAVLAHWVEAGRWWLGRVDRAGQADHGGQGAHTFDDRDREFWRVEARPAGVRTPEVGGVYDLRFDWSAGTWSVTRVHD